MKQIKLKAPAKINLSLDILGTREDGYHELEMIMQTIDLYDEVNLEKTESEIIDLYMLNSDLPEGKGNLAYQAAEIILNKADIENQGVKITIKKNIPEAAGLGGGSSDAAAVLKGINKLFNLGYSSQILKNLGSQIGMDVPFFIKGGTALAVGRGDVIKQLPDLKSYLIVLINPPFLMSTAEVYKKFDEILDEKKPDLNIPTSRLVKIIKSGKKIKWNEGWGNVLESSSQTINNDIKKIKKQLENFETELTMMSGSGPTIFAVVKNHKIAEKIKKKWSREKDNVLTTSTLKGENITDTF